MAPRLAARGMVTELAVAAAAAAEAPLAVAIAAFFEATVRTATPLAYAAVGETISERAGVINLGLEGSIIAGALAATIAGITVGTGAGFVAGALAGMVVALVLAAFVTGLRADQIITGTAVTLLALGLTGTVYRLRFGDAGVALAVPTLGAVVVPGLARLPLVGRALFAQPLPTYGLYLLVPAVWWWLQRTHAGLALRAVGENPAAARAAGISPRLVQLRALLVGGTLGGACGATLVLAQVGTFAEGMSAGRGFIAVAIVALGRWRPVRAALAALLFGAASALQYLFQAMGWAVPYQLFLALPYVLTLVALAGGGLHRGGAPAALGARETAHA